MTSVGPRGLGPATWPWSWSAGLIFRGNWCAGRAPAISGSPGGRFRPKIQRKPCRKPENPFGSIEVVARQEHLHVAGRGGARAGGLFQALLGPSIITEEIVCLTSTWQSATHTSDQRSLHNHALFFFMAGVLVTNAFFIADFMADFAGMDRSRRAADGVGVEAV